MDRRFYPQRLDETPTQKTLFITVPYIHDGVHHIPLRWFSKSSIARQPRGYLYRTTCLAESSRRDDSNTDLFGTGTIPTAVEIYYPNCRDTEGGKSAQAGVIYSVVYSNMSSLEGRPSQAYTRYLVYDKLL